MQNFKYAISLIPSPFSKYLIKQITVPAPQLQNNCYGPSIRALTVPLMKRTRWAESSVESASSEDWRAALGVQGKGQPNLVRERERRSTELVGVLTGLPLPLPSLHSDPSVPCAHVSLPHWSLLYPLPHSSSTNMPPKSHLICDSHLPTGIGSSSFLFKLRL